MAEAVLLVAATLVEVALVEVTSADWAVLGLGAPDFAQPRRGSGVPILPVEVSADQPVHSNTITEVAARLALGQTNSADLETNRRLGQTNSADLETNRRNRMPAGTQTLLASRIVRHH